MSKSVVHIDLHPIAKQGDRIDEALHATFTEAERKRLRTIEIITGKGSGQLKHRVLKFLDQKSIKQRYHRVDKDAANHGRLFVHFRWKYES